VDRACSRKARSAMAGVLLGRERNWCGGEVGEGAGQVGQDYAQDECKTKCALHHGWPALVAGGTVADAVRRRTRARLG
jgi:hypothetical protein